MRNHPHCLLLPLFSCRPASRVRFSSTAVIADDYHVPVLRSEAVEWLISDPSGTYVDGTLGGGGHSAALLEVLAPQGGHLISVDRDPDALRTAGDRLKPYVTDGHSTIIRSNFG